MITEINCMYFQTLKNILILINPLSREDIFLYYKILITKS